MHLTNIYLGNGEGKTESLSSIMIKYHTGVNFNIRYNPESITYEKLLIFNI